MNPIKDKEIAIIGGGPSGLTLARLLQMNGADVKVYERDANKDSRPKGATLDLHEESGLAALEAAGLMNAFWANYRPGADKMLIMDEKGNVLYDEHSEVASDRGRPEIDRGPLQNILLDSLKPGTVVWNSQFVSMSQQNCVWKIEFKNEEVVFADMVIAADGANSKIRPYVTSVRPFYAGVTAIEGAVYNSQVNCPKIHALLDGGKIFAMGNEQRLIVGGKGDGSLVFYPGFKCDENWAKESGIDFNDKAQVIAWFHEYYKGWDEMWLELFENATTAFIPRPQYCMPPGQTWEAQPNLTLLGDAAHLMPPYAGEGVNMAMLDALELSQCLLNPEYSDTLGAISAYEKQMRSRASATAEDTLASTEILHSNNAIDFMMNMGA
jgi:2-polyprenyl-6-methoxyphenol hydroxylase-like FAD-dependent oxidoreductase